MKDQLSCFDFAPVGDIEVARIPGPMARDKDPITSHAAAASMREEAKKHRTAILRLLADGTARHHQQIDDDLEWPHPTAARRLAELRRAGLIRQVKRAIIRQTGRLATVYTITDKGRGAL